MVKMYVGMVGALALLAVACGGGDSAGDSATESAATEAVEFPAATMTSDEVCSAIDNDAIVSIYAGINALAEPTSNDIGCWFSVWDGENVSGETTITLLNNGGAAAYEERLAFWGERSQPGVPVADFVGTGEAALMVTDIGKRAVMHTGDDRLWEVTVGVTGDADILEQILRAVATSVA